MLRMVLIVLGIFLFQGRAGAVSVDTEEGLKSELQKEEGDNVIEISKIWKYPAIWEKPAVLP